MMTKKIILGCQKVLENTLSIYLGGENLPTVTIIGTCMWLHAANLSCLSNLHHPAQQVSLASFLPMTRT